MIFNEWVTPHAHILRCLALRSSIKHLNRNKL